MQETNPALFETIDRLLTIDERSVDSPQGSELRLANMADTMLQLVPWARLHGKKGVAEVVSIFVAVMFVLSVVGLIPLLVMQHPLWPLAVGVVALLLGALVYRMIFSTRIAAGNAMVPMLARALFAIDPDEDEVREVLEDRMDSRFYKHVKIRPSKLCGQIDQLISKNYTL